MQIASLLITANSQVSTGGGTAASERTSRPGLSGQACQYCYSGSGYEVAQEAFSLKYQSQDGDILELTYANQSITGVNRTANEDNGAVSLVDMMENIKNFIKAQEEKLIGILLGEGDNGPATGNVKDKGVLKVSDLNIPDYWNAENTSQRIVDFAVSFYEGSGKEAEEFGKMIIDAVEEGFEQAKGMLGSLSDEVNGLVSETEALTMDKLNAWVADRTAALEALAA